MSTTEPPGPHSGADGPPSAGRLRHPILPAQERDVSTWVVFVASVLASIAILVITAIQAGKGQITGVLSVALQILLLIASVIATRAIDQLRDDRSSRRHLLIIGESGRQLAINLKRRIISLMAQTQTIRVAVKEANVDQYARRVVIANLDALDQAILRTAADAHTEALQWDRMVASEPKPEEVRADDLLDHRLQAWLKDLEENVADTIGTAGADNEASRRTEELILAEGLTEYLTAYKRQRSSGPSQHP
jgi:hypothetical protein